MMYGTRERSRSSCRGLGPPSLTRRCLSLWANGRCLLRTSAVYSYSCISPARSFTQYNFSSILDFSLQSTRRNTSRCATELIDESRTDDPLQHAAAATAKPTKQQTKNSDDNRRNQGRRYQDDDKRNPIPKTDCKGCAFAHQGGGANCWWMKPHLAPASCGNAMLRS